MEIIYRLLADAIWVLHLAVLLIALLGGLFPAILPLYVIVLLLILASNLYFDYCVLSKWEFAVRKKIDPTVDYEYSYASYYTHQLTHGYISPLFIRRAGMLFVSVSLLIVVYFN